LAEIYDTEVSRETISKIADQVVAGHGGVAVATTRSRISMAVPIRDERHDAVAAINTAVHTEMISLADLVDQLLLHLFATADHISARLGYRRDDERVS
jgi:DNA-binding IclR family transcriptional regulator